MRPGIPASLLFICALSLSSPAQAQRLPTTVVPDHYDLAFDVDLGTARFSGTETIHVRLLEPARRIVLNALDIQFQDVTIDAGGTAQKATVTLNDPTESAALTVPRELPRGPADIHVRYTGILNDQLRGFYLSKANGRSYAVTQFESTDARRAFPSFDEPVYKATFALALTIDQADTAISNGRILSDTPVSPARHTLKFSTTPKMSSYLVAMAVGDFQCLEDAAEGIPVRICATPDKKALGQVALNAAKRVLAFYNGYYSIKYPFGKLDMVAVPDFAAGAMENTAAIFYRETDLLADEKTASVSNLKRIWVVVAHEMAHQWFGDLVTMRWWDDLWLNEGFATWMEKRPLAAAKPEWNVEVDEALDTQRAMDLDALASTRPIHSPVETPGEIEGSFDRIAYEKGASVMRMVEGYLGAEPFRKGVNVYIEKHAYGNATSEDFWTTMAASSGKPIDRILPTFVNQPGVPLVEARLVCNAGQPQLALATRRFFVNPAMASATAGNTKWQIPVCTKTAGPANVSCDVVSGPSARMSLNDPQCPSWVFINAGAHGYYRTAYEPPMLRKLAPDVAASLTAPERLLLMGDEWALVRAARHTVADYLTLASEFSRERVSGVLRQVTTPLEFLHDHVATSQTRPEFESFVRALLRPTFEELGITAVEGENDDRRELRATVVETLGTTGNDREVVTRARAVLDRALSGEMPLEPTAAGAIVSVAAEHGDAALFDALVAAARRATSPAEHYRYLYALGSFSDPSLIQRGLMLALSPELRSQDTATYLGRFLTNPAATAAAWAFVKQHWTELAPKITISLGDARLVESLGSACDPRLRDDIRSFFATHKLPAASRTLDQTLERINNCIALKDKQAPVLARWLSAR
jgi:aminopeptidase N